MIPPQKNKSKKAAASLRAAAAALLVALMPSPCRAQQAQPTTDLRQLLATRSPIWAASQSRFVKEHPAFAKASRDTVIAPDNAVQFEGVPLPACAVKYDSAGRAISLESTLHDSASHGLLESLLFVTADVDAIKAACKNWAGKSGMVTESPGSGKTTTWGRYPSLVSIVETFHPRTHAPVSAKLVAEPWPPRSDLAQNVRREGGATWIDVPMVEQEERGLCAPATIERVMRYYRIPVAINDLTDPAGLEMINGVSVRELLEKVDGANGSHCKVKEYFGFRASRFKKLIEKYNREADKRRIARLAQNGELALDLSDTFMNADPDVLRVAASSGHGDEKFFRIVKDSIDRGVPLVWGVVLGIVREPGLTRDARGGHLRLIIGYDAARREIIFSDTWGAVHSRKSLPLSSAWSITMTLHSVLP